MDFSLIQKPRKKLATVLPSSFNNIGIRSHQRVQKVSNQPPGPSSYVPKGRLDSSVFGNIYQY